MELEGIENVADVVRNELMTCNNKPVAATVCLAQYDVLASAYQLCSPWPQLKRHQKKDVFLHNPLYTDGVKAFAR